MARLEKSRRASVERRLSGTYVIPASAVRKALAEWAGRKD
jgi:hypothetical protein